MKNSLPRARAAPLATVVAFALVASLFGGCARTVEHARVVRVPSRDGHVAYYRVVVRARGKTSLRAGTYDAAAVDAVAGTRSQPDSSTGRRPRARRRYVVIYSRAAAAIEQHIARAAADLAARRVVRRAARALGRPGRRRQHLLRARLARAQRLLIEVRRGMRELGKLRDTRQRAAALRRLLEDVADLPVDADAGPAVGRQAPRPAKPRPGKRSPGGRR